MRASKSECGASSWISALLCRDTRLDSRDPEVEPRDLEQAMAAAATPTPPHPPPPSGFRVTDGTDPSRRVLPIGGATRSKSLFETAALLLALLVSVHLLSDFLPWWAATDAQLVQELRYIRAVVQGHPRSLIESARETAALADSGCGDVLVSAGVSGLASDACWMAGRLLATEIITQRAELAASVRLSLEFHDARNAQVWLAS